MQTVMHCRMRAMHRQWICYACIATGYSLPDSRMRIRSDSFNADTVARASDALYARARCARWLRYVCTAGLCSHA